MPVDLTSATPDEVSAGQFWRWPACDSQTTVFPGAGVGVVAGWATATLAIAALRTTDMNAARTDSRTATLTGHLPSFQSRTQTMSAP